MITTQYRAKRSMVYELKRGDATLTLHITPDRGETDSRVWHVEARNDRTSSVPTTEGRGSTAADALREAGRNWMSREAFSSRGAFDWEVVLQTLRAVRAV